MQPTAADEALIGEALRLSNARESWLGHSLLPVAQRVADDIIEQQVWGRIRGEKREKSRCPETAGLERCWLRGMSLSRKQSYCWPEQVPTGRIASHGIFRCAYDLAIQGCSHVLMLPGQRSRARTKTAARYDAILRRHHVPTSTICGARRKYVA
ncbi:uncharacterized protein TrAtP1_003638 [Trichoderma atroviride]|uniref:uncharacterized protein n=1 Tax=Hypocrea atroviridis TaxID=63577 RepID=UPI00332093DB|nr:hypothetical protein TrAtP1_003638 [Trichoderma atroviride]